MSTRNKSIAKKTAEPILRFRKVKEIAGQIGHAYNEPSRRCVRIRKTWRFIMNDGSKFCVVIQDVSELIKYIFRIYLINYIFNFICPLFETDKKNNFYGLNCSLIFFMKTMSKVHFVMNRSMDGCTRLRD